MRTRRTVIPGRESMVIVPAWRSTMTASGDVEAKTGALADVLGGVNASKARAATCGGIPGPVSPIATTTWSPSARVVTLSVRAVHRVDGVVDETGLYLVEFAGVGLDSGVSP